MPQLPIKISSKHWEAMKKLLLNDSFANQKQAEPPRLFGIPVIVDDSLKPDEVKLVQAPKVSDSNYSDALTQMLKERAKLFNEMPQAHTKLMGLEAEPLTPKPKQIELRYCACNHLLEQHVDSGGVCVLGSCACTYFNLKKVHQTITPKYLGSTATGESYTMGVDWSDGDHDKTAIATMVERNRVQALQLARDYIKQQLEAQASVAEAAKLKAVGKAKVVKTRKERKLALDKDI